MYQNDISAITTRVNGGDFALGHCGDLHELTQCKITHLYKSCECKNPSMYSATTSLTYTIRYFFGMKGLWDDICRSCPRPHYYTIYQTNIMSR